MNFFFFVTSEKSYLMITFRIEVLCPSTCASELLKFVLNPSRSSQKPCVNACYDTPPRSNMDRSALPHKRTCYFTPQCLSSMWHHRPEAEKTNESSAFRQHGRPSLLPPLWPGAAGWSWEMLVLRLKGAVTQVLVSCRHCDDDDDTCCKYVFSSQDKAQNKATMASWCLLEVLSLD